MDNNIICVVVIALLAAVIALLAVAIALLAVVAAAAADVALPVSVSVSEPHNHHETSYKPDRQPR